MKGTCASSVRDGSGSDRTHGIGIKIRTQNGGSLECGRYGSRTVPSGSPSWIRLLSLNVLQLIGLEDCYHRLGSD
jgi:hypothetical protein